MEGAVLKDDSDDGAALPKGRATRPSGFGVLDRETARKVVSNGTIPGAAASRCRPTALPATGKVCWIKDFDLTAPEIRVAARRRGGRVQFPVSVPDDVLRTAPVAHAASAFRTGVPSSTLRAGDPAVLEKPTAGAGAQQFVMPRLPHRPQQVLPDLAARAMVKRGTTFGEWPRDWDCAIWPHANAGLSKSDQHILRSLEKAQTA